MKNNFITITGMNHLLTTEELDLLEDLIDHSREAIMTPISAHMDHWNRFYRNNTKRLRDCRTPVLVFYEQEFIDPKELFNIFESNV